MGKVRAPRYLVGKRQKGGHVLWYWQPSKSLRQAGFLTHRLAERTNQLADAIQEAEKLNAELDAWRAGQLRAPIEPGTLPWLIKLYRSDPRYTRLTAKTQLSYDQCLGLIDRWSARAGHPPISTIQRKHVRQFYRSMEHTPAKAAAAIRVLRLLMNFAVDEGAIEGNPAERPHLPTGAPRDAIWTREQVARLVQTAQEMGRLSVGLAVLLAANLGQREGDILRLAWSQYDGFVIRLRQRKTGTLIEIPVSNELKQALDRTPRASTNIVISETTGRPYKEYNFSHVFRRIALAARIEGLLFMDLRRTAVVWLAEAQCTVPEIAAITGHQIEHTARILQTYCPLNSTMARNAIAKLEQYRKRTELEG